jgi:hypothetical protein
MLELLNLLSTVGGTDFYRKNKWFCVIRGAGFSFTNLEIPSMDLED